MCSARDLRRGILAIILIAAVTALLPAPASSGAATPDAAAMADELLNALTELKQKDGRDNAMIYYVTAQKIAAGLPIPDSKQNQLITQVLKQGWIPQVASLTPLLTAHQSAFQEIRKGAALDYARNIGWKEKGINAPIPNFLHAQISAKLLCVEGRALESQGNFADALNDYLTVLTMGRDYGAPDASLIGHLIATAVQSIAIDRIYMLVAGGRLDRPTLDRLLARLQAIETTQNPMVNGFRVEADFFEATLKALLAGQIPMPKDGSANDLTNQTERLRADHKRVWDAVFKQMETPYWKQDLAASKQELDQILATCHPLVKTAVPNHWEADARFLVMRAKLLEAQLAAALAAWKLEKGKYPQRLSELVPAFFQTLPADPFSGTEFRYLVTPDASHYGIYSVGPDKTDDGAKVLYDPSKGALSSGDIFY
jgi:hypothetical protein